MLPYICEYLFMTYSIQESNDVGSLSQMIGIQEFVRRQRVLFPGPIQALA
jgi:hypothetical protein